MVRPTIGFCCALGNAITALTVSQPVVVETLGHTPAGWRNLGPANHNQLIRLSITLQSRGEGLLEKTLAQIADPGHPKYGQHLSRDEASKLLGPSQDAVDSVRRWLVSANIPQSRIDYREHSIDTVVSMKVAEKLLSTEYRVFERDDGRKAIGTLFYSVPVHVRPYITAIQPTTFFELSASNKRLRWTQSGSIDSCRYSRRNITDAQVQHSSQKAECDRLNTPFCLRELYKMWNPLSMPDAKSLLGVVGFSEVSLSVAYTLSIVVRRRAF